MSTIIASQIRNVVFVFFTALSILLPASSATAFWFDPIEPSVLMSAAPQTILTGGSSVIVWTVSGADTCIASGGWTGSKNVIGGEYPVAPVVTTTYTLTCTGPGGTSTDSVTITVEAAPTTPACEIETSPASIVSGQSATLSWSVENAMIVSINNGIGTVPASGSRVVSPNSSTSYVLSATGPNGVASCSWWLNVGPVAKPNLEPAAPIVLASGNLQQGSEVAFTSQIKNSSAQSTGIGYQNNFSYRYGNSGTWIDLTPFNSKSALAGFTTALPDTSPRFTLAQSGTLQVQYCGDSDRRINEEDEFDNCTVYAFVVAPAPQAVNISLSANPRTITNGGSSVLTWNVTGADSCTATEGWSGAKNPTGGTQTVSPAVTTTYALTCTGPGGSETKQETVTVTNLLAMKPNLAPAAPVTLMGGTLVRGQLVSFMSHVHNTGTVSTGIGFHNNFSYRFNGGSWIDITPFNSKSALAGLSSALSDVSPNFVLPLSGTLEVQYCVDSYRVIDEESEIDNCIYTSFAVTEPATAPEISLSANPRTITNGGSSVLTWNVTGADSCTATEGWSGAKNPTGGTQTVSPAVTTTYALTCTGPGGSETKQETVTVTNLPTGGGTMTLDFSVCNSDGVTGCVTNGTKYVAPSTPLSVRWSATGADSCIGSSNIVTNGNTSGTRAVVASGLPNDSEFYQVSCTNGGTPISKAVTVRTSVVTPTLIVTPTLVRAGDSVRVSWDTGNGDETACVLGGGGVNSAATLGNGTGGSDTGSADVRVYSRTTFTLVCGTLSAPPVTVEIRPTAFET